MNTPLMCAIRELILGDVTYTFCDKIDLDRHYEQKDITPQVASHVMQVGQIVPLGRLAYRTLMVQRPAGTVGKGFTIAELVERGILDADEGAALESKKPVQHTGAIGELEAYGDYFIRSKKIGNFTNYDVLDANQKLLRDKAFRTRDKAIAFLDELAAAKQAA